MKRGCLRVARARWRDMHDIKARERKRQSIGLVELKWIIRLPLNIHSYHFKSCAIKAHAHPASLTAKIKQARSFLLHPFVSLVTSCFTGHPTETISKASKQERKIASKKNKVNSTPRVT